MFTSQIYLLKVNQNRSTREMKEREEEGRRLIEGAERGEGGEGK